MRESLNKDYDRPIFREPLLRWIVRKETEAVGKHFKDGILRIGVWR
jgi:hypothetical protein